MLYASSEDFLSATNKRVTLMGMSNVGKTTLASLLPRTTWFHYSVDFRLTTAHLRDEIVDTLKIEMMKSPYLAQILLDDAMKVDVIVSFKNLSIVSHYLGMLGNPDKGGLPEAEFRERQARHRAAEIAAIQAVPHFIASASKVYNYPHFINDASGSLCEVIDVEDPADPVLAAVIENTLLVYILADDSHEARLVEAARSSPKPLYYRPEFLDESLDDYLNETGLRGTDKIDPKQFGRWVFPRLLAARRPRYGNIAEHGYVVTAREVERVRGEDDFLRLIGEAIDRTNQAGKYRSIAHEQTNTPHGGMASQF